eukprot:scaffold1147_cov68-Phaeocystis_antarctica.AAC.16
MLRAGLGHRRARRTHSSATRPPQSSACRTAARLRGKQGGSDSASWLSGGCSQRQIVPQATPSFGQPRPISRLGRAGRPYRPCFPHSSSLWLSA